MKLHNEMKQKSKRESEELQLLSKSKDCNVRQGFRGNCDFQGKLGMCPSLAESDSGGIPKTGFSERFSVATVPPEQLQNICFPVRFHKAERSCSPRLEKLSLFSPLPPCARSMARGFRCLRLVHGIPHSKIPRSVFHQLKCNCKRRFFPILIISAAICSKGVASLAV